MIKKKNLISLLLAVVLICTCGMFACGNNVESLREKCKVAFDYFEAINEEIQFYNIEEFEVCNDNISDNHKNYFEDGKCYKITIYRQILWTDVKRDEYFFGKLEGEDVLYKLGLINQSNHYLKKIDMKNNL